MPIQSLKGRLIVIILGIYLVVGALTVLAFVLAARTIAEKHAFVAGETLQERVTRIAMAKPSPPYSSAQTRPCTTKRLGRNRMEVAP